MSPGGYYTHHINKVPFKKPISWKVGEVGKGISIEAVLVGQELFAVSTSSGYSIDGDWEKH